MRKIVYMCDMIHIFTFSLQWPQIELLFNCASVKSDLISNNKWNFKKDKCK